MGVLAIIFGVLAFIAVASGLGAMIKPPPKYRRRDGAAALGVGVLLLIIALALNPSAPVQSASSPPAPSDSPVQTASNAAPLGEAFPSSQPSQALADDERVYRLHGAEIVAAFQRRMGAGAPDLGFCSEGAAGEGCRVSQYEWATEYWEAAHKGDIEAIRNVAFCLSTSCEGAIVPNRVQGCAWRLMVIASGSHVVNETDTDNARLECGALDEVARISAADRAAEIARRIPRLFEPK